MDWDDKNSLEHEKSILSVKIGCFFGVIMMGLLAVLVIGWHALFPQETLLKASESPNKINMVEIVRKNDFPDPTIRINYDQKSIMKTKIPDSISVEWRNDYEATVILEMQGREPSIVDITFEE